MKVKNEISEELRSLSMVIEAISRDIPPGIPYVVPVDYFRDFPGQVMNRIYAAGPNVLDLLPPAEELALTSLLPGKAAPFQVPEGYFEGLAGGILDRIKQSRADMAGGAARTQVAGTSDVPGGEAAAELALLSPLLSRIDRKTPYHLPEGYFNELAPVLAGLQDKSLYEVPQGYFEGLAAVVLAKVQQPTPSLAERPAPARVISMGGKRGWWKYSATAVVAGLVLTIGWLRWHSSGHGTTPVTPDLANTLAKVSDQDIQNYLDNDNDNINMPLAEAVTNSTATLDMDDNDVTSLLGEVPDGELKQYMEEHGGAKDLATN